MKIKKSFLSDILFVCLGLLLMLFFFILYRQIHSLNESYDAVTHANVTKLKLEQAFSALKDAETGQRGFLLTRDSLFLSPHKKAADRFYRSVAELDSLVNDNEQQKKHIFQLKSLAEARLKILNNVLSLPPDPFPKPGRLTPYLLQGKYMMDSIYQHVNAMSYLEDSLLHRRIALRERDSFMTPLYALICVSFTLLVLLISFFRIRTDFKEQQKLKEEILVSKIFLQSLLDASTEVIAALDGNLNYVVVNKSTEDYYHIKRENVIGKHLYEVFPRLKGSENGRLFEHVLKGNPVLNRVVKSEITGQYFENTMVPLYSADGKVTGMLAIGRDLTPVYQKAEELQHKNEELERSNQELASFSYVASHDLQEPLRKIQSFAGRILEKDSEHFSPTTKDYFDRIVSAAKRMQSLIDSLLNFSRTNTTELKFEPVDFNILLDEIKSNLKENIEEKKALIESTPLPTLEVIPIQFHQLLLNLIGNSLKYSKAGVPPHIRISADIVKGSDWASTGIRPSQNYWKITVADNGIGFDKQYEYKIFELFQRLHGKTEYSGTGIGLAICKKIAQNHHGVITASGEPGIGSVFNIYLPLSK